MAQQALEYAKYKLTDEQTEIIEECMKKSRFGLSVPMGRGKTFMSIIIGLQRLIESNSTEPILVIAAKSLIPSWEVEIEKFFGKMLEYQIIGIGSKDFVLNKTTLLVLVTAETAGKYYDYNVIHEKFIKREYYPDPKVRFMLVKNVYNPPTKPFLKVAVGGSIIYNRRWASLIIDEGHKYTNISSKRSQAIAAICSDYRFILSGTLFDEPDFIRILGYHTLLHLDFPRDLPNTIEFLKSQMYTGLKHTIVERSGSHDLIGIKINKQIVQHDLTPEEGKIYTAMKMTLNVLKKTHKKLSGTSKRKFSVYILSMIAQLRQGVVVPIIPIANIMLEFTELKNTRSVLSNTLYNEFQKAGLIDFIHDEKSAKSSRIDHILKTLNKHTKPTDKMIIFSCFSTSLNMIEYYIKKETNLKVFRLLSTQTLKARGQLIKNYQNCENNAVLLTTYELGAEGLNLQCANGVIIVDFWWNQSKTKQAIARVLRRGQKSKTVNIYFFTSNTGIERSLFVKQQDKELLLEELKKGPVTKSVGKVTMDQILRLIDSNENSKFITENYI